MSKPSELGALKIGSYIMIEGEPCRIVEYDKSKPGKHGSAKARIAGVGIFDSAKRHMVNPVSAQVEVPLIDKRMGQVISKTDTVTQIMDSETFEVFDASIIEDEIKDRLAQGQDIEYWKVLDRTKIVRIKS